MPPSSSDEDEVQYIPYTKPPPPLIDLLESSEDDDDQASSKSNKKKKKKQSSTSFIPCSVTKTLLQSSSSSSTEIVGQTTISPPSAAINAGKRSEQLVINPVHNNAGTSGDLNVASLSGKHNRSLTHVGANSSPSTGGNHLRRTKEHPSLPSNVRVATSSVFEPNNDDALGGGLSIPRSDKNGVIVGLEGNNNKLGNRKTQVTEKATTSKRKRTSTSPASSSDASTPSRREKLPSKKQISKQRTSEEINNFLVTLGVLGSTPAVEESPPPPKEKRAKKSKKVRDPPPPEQQDDVLPLDASSSEKKRKKKKASKSDKETVREKKASKSSEETVGETYEQRKLRLKTANQRSRDETETVVVSRRSKSRIPEDQISPASDEVDFGNQAPSTSLFADVNPSPTVGMLTRAERAALSFNVSSVLKSPKSSKHVSPSTPISPSREDNRRQRELPDKIIGMYPPHPCNSPGLDPTIPKPDGNVNNARGQQNDPPPVYLPSFWTPAMVKFYDTTINDNFHTSHALATMPDYPTLWKTNEKELTPNGPRGLRCFNCSEFGHKASVCPEIKKHPVCHYCGQSGHGFISARDRDDRRFGNPHPCFKAICLSCGRQQGKYVCHSCPECQVTKNKKTPSCEICDIDGHTSAHCPDNWRKFFSTTKGHQNEDGTISFYGDKPVYKLHKDSYCAVCSYKGHRYFNCRSTCKTSGDKYTRHNVRIFNELPRLPTKRIVSATAVSSSPVSPSDTVDTARQNRHHSSEADDAIGQAPGESTKSDGNSKCMDPECRNKLKPKTFCYEMSVNSVEHELMLTAQNDKEISNLVGKKAQITVFQERKAIHIYSDSDNIEAQIELVKVVREMKEKKTKNSPDVIVVKDEEKKDVGDPSYSSAKANDDQLIVSLTECERRLVQEELLKKDGLFAQLAEKLNVVVKVSPDSPAVTCEGGTDENRRLTRKNIFAWLECKMYNMEYTIQLRLIPNPVTNTHLPLPPPVKRKHPPSPKPSRAFTNNNKQMRLNNQKNDDDIVPNKPAPKFAIWDLPPQPTHSSSYDFHNNNLSFPDFNNNNNNNPFNFASSQQIPFSNDRSGFFNNFYTGDDFHPSFNTNNRPPFHHQQFYPPPNHNNYYQNNYVNNPFHQQQYNCPPRPPPPFMDNGYFRGGRGRGAPAPNSYKHPLGREDQIPDGIRNNRLPIIITRER
ncbi:uncharacterized protein LOC110853339 isoform X2 [Folsomia candida]|uniref:uncharacterized protein LOC110853339 isoform X2 n=1 Tax=Folsomia candida TaxID=158441 RepID=UPI001605346E|nr:uncharacterized protein LOC110853339 isoform X2 [Folsomia candida]